MASGSAGATASEAAASAGARANLARAVIRKASERVCERITIQNMEQSFPDFVDSDRAYIEQLQKQTTEQLEATFKQVFDELFTEPEFKDFDARANAVDQVLAAASNRRARQEEPQDAWKLGADPVLAIQAAVVPKLQASLETSQRIKAELGNETEARVQRILSMQAEVHALDTEIQDILHSIEETSANLKAIDIKAVQELQDNMLPFVDADKL